jgi:hypothetical protein
MAGSSRTRPISSPRLSFQLSKVPWLRYLIQPSLSLPNDGSEDCNAFAASFQFPGGVYAASFAHAIRVVSRTQTPETLRKFALMYAVKCAVAS